MGKKIGLSTEKDAGYSRLMVVCSAILSGFTFGLPVFQGVLTGEWKVMYKLDLDTASIHQRYFQACLYLGNMFLSAFYQKLSPQKWLAISSLVGTMGYGVLYAAYWLDFKYFTACQYIFGILGGLGSGLSFGLICITPQHWLDKTRNKMNPYLFIGAPIVVVVIAPIGQILVNMLGWPNALLLVTGFFLQQWVLVALFIEHPSELNKDNGEVKSSPTMSETLQNYWDVIKMEGTLAWMLNCAVCSGFILSGVFTELVNIAVATGVDSNLASQLILFSAIPEVLIFRPLWGKLTDYASVGTWQIVWMSIFLVSQVTLALAVDTWQWILGVGLFSCALSGYSGLKFVLHLDMVGDKHMQYMLTFDTALAALFTILVPTVANDLGQKNNTPKLLFWINSAACFLCIFTSVYIWFKRQSNIEKRKQQSEKNLDTNRNEEEMQLKE